MMKMLLEYIKDHKGKRIGVVVALSADCIGWSLCKKCDKFDPKLGQRIAEGRAADRKDYSFEIPHTVKPYVEKMTERANRYFKKDYDDIPF